MFDYFVRMLIFMVIMNYFIFGKIFKILNENNS